MCTYTTSISKRKRKGKEPVELFLALKKKYGHRKALRLTEDCLCKQYHDYRGFREVELFIKKNKRIIKMGSLKNILIHCKENEKEFAANQDVSRDRDRNQGWIECCEFFLRNFDITEKEIKGDTHEN